MADPQNPPAPGAVPATVAGNPDANVPGKPETQGGPDKAPPPGSMNNPIPQQVPKSATPNYNVSDFSGAAGGPFSVTGNFGDTPGQVLVDGVAVPHTRWTAQSIKGELPKNVQRGAKVQIRTASGHVIDHRY